MLDRLLSIPQPPKETLPTMRDLPSQHPEDPGLPDVFHGLQPEVLRRTCRSPNCPIGRMFMGSDINLYYDWQHVKWFKRPDWFLVVGVDRTPPNEEERRKFPYRESYVLWQEEVAPLLIVELLSPGTAKEDLGRFAAADPEALALDVEAESTPTNSRSNRDSPPSKWEVYESYLRVPYYVVFNEKTARVRLFRHLEGAYQEVRLEANNPQIWIEELGIGLGVWRGEYEGVTCAWLRWYDAEGNWIPTEEEAERQLREQAQADAEKARTAEQEARIAEQEARAAEQEARAAEQEAKTEAQHAIEQLQQGAKNLLRSGIDAQQVAVLLGLDIEQVRQLAAEI